MINYFISKIIVVGLATIDFLERTKYDNKTKDEINVPIALGAFYRDNPTTIKAVTRGVL